MGEPKHIWLVHLRPQFSELEKLNDASLASASPLHLLGSSRQQPRSWEEDPQKEGMLWTLEVSWCQNLHHNCAKSEPKADYSHLLNPIFGLMLHEMSLCLGVQWVLLWALFSELFSEETVRVPLCLTEQIITCTVTRLTWLQFITQWHLLTAQLYWLR